MRTNAIITCAGKGLRANLGYNKLRFDIGGIPLVLKTINAFIRDDIDNIYITYNIEDKDFFENLTSTIDKNIFLIEGGNTRTESIYNALKSISECDLVLIHDGARPFISQEDISNVLEVAKEKNNATLYTTPFDATRTINTDSSSVVDKTSIALVQTPQIFNYELLLKAYDKAINSKDTFLDDASVYEKYIGKINLVKSIHKNNKITTKEDLTDFIPASTYVGVGWDTHELVENRDLIIGGIKIPHTKGLLGHSDADVLVHAIMDALLSATSNKDIGVLFPDTDIQYKGISSIKLLKHVYNLISSQGYIISNISAVIMAQKPKFKDYIQSIQKNIASVLNLDEFRVTISATTTEKLGLIGHEEAISSNAYCIVIKQNS